MLGNNAASTTFVQNTIRATMATVPLSGITGGTYSSISNVKAYSDGANGLGTGVLLWAKAVASYATPAEATATTGYTNFFSYTSGAALSLGAGPFTSTGEKGDHLVMMCEVQSTASGGLTPSETLTVAWDEI